MLKLLNTVKKIIPRLRRSFFFVLLVAVVFSFSMAQFVNKLLAAPPTSQYLPGETLNPNCAPGDTNCTVNPPLSATTTLHTGSLLFIYNASGTVGENNSNFFWDNTNTRLGLGTSSPATLFSVATSSPIFNVSSSGAIGFANIFYNFPTSQGSANTALTNNGSGGLSWTTYATIAGSGSGWNTSGSFVYLSTSTNFVGIGTAQPSSTLHLVGTNTSTISLANTLSGGKRFDLRVGTLASGTLDVFDNTSSTSRFVIDRSGNIGIGTSTPGNPLDIENSNNNVATVSETAKTITDATVNSNWVNIQSDLTLNSSVNDSFTEYYAGAFNNNVAASNTKNYYELQGVSANVSHKGSGTVSFTDAIDAFAGGTGAGSITNNIAIIALADHGGSGSITNNYGMNIRTGRLAAGTNTNDYTIYVRSPEASGTLTNHYGLYLEAQNIGTTNYAIYSAGTNDQSYIAGRLGLGTAFPSSTLHLVGTNTSTISLANTLTGGKRFDLRVGGNASGTFDVFDNTSSSSRFMVDAAGNVGIATTQPSSTLHVVGTFQVTGQSTLASVSSTNFTASGYGIIPTLTFTSASGTNITVSGYGTFPTLNSTNAALTNVSSTNITLTGYGTVPTLNFTSASGTNLTVSGYGTFPTLNSTNAALTNISSTNVTASGYGTFPTLNSTNAALTNVSSTNLTASGYGLFGSLITTGNLTAVSSTLSGFTAGSIPFFGSGGVLAQNNANLFWDNTNNRLGLGTAQPSSTLHLVGTNTSTISLANTLTGGKRFDLRVGGNASGTFDVFDNTSSSSRFMVDAAGNVAVGSTTAATLFSVATSSNIFNVNANGNVGIGTTNPGSILDVRGTITFGNVCCTGIDNTQAVLNNNFGVTMGNFAGIGILALEAGGAERVRITNLGNLGIGSATSTYSKLTVDGLPPQNATSTLALLGSNFITGGSASGTFLGANPTSTFNGDFINFQVGSTTQFKVSATGTTYFAGNVGVGTSSPATLFAVATSSNIFNVLANGNVGVGTSSPATLFSVATSSNIFNVLANGNVGVGTSTPSNKLHIQSPGEAIVALTNNGATSNGTWGFAIGSGNQFGHGQFAIGTGATVTPSNAQLRLQGDGSLIIGNTASNNAAIQSATSTLVIQGNLPTTVAGNEITFNVNNQGTLAGTAGTQDIIQINQSFAPASGTGIFNVLDLGPTINQTGGANGVTRGLYINPTLTSSTDFRAIETVSGNVIFGSTSGNVGVGTAFPSSTLHLVGTNTSTISLANTLSGGKRFDLRVGGNASGTFDVFDNTSSSTRLLIDRSGNVVVGSTTAATLFSVATSSNIFNVLANGNVGVGTSTPQAQLSIKASGSSVGLIVQGSDGVAHLQDWYQAGGGLAASIGDDGGLGIKDGSKICLDALSPCVTYVQESGGINFVGGAGRNITINSSGYDAFLAGGSEAMRIISDGKVGLGTATPSSTLHLVGTNTSTISLANTLSGGKRFDLRVGGNASGTFDVFDNTSSTSRFTIDAAGNVGVGTAFPSSTLHVVGGNTTLATTTLNGELRAVSSTLTTLTVTSCTGCGGGGALSTSSAITAGYFPYWVNATGGLNGTSSLFINTANNFIGIGTASPSSTLHVAGLPTQNATSTLLLLGSNFIGGGSTSGTFIGINPTSTFNGDFLNFQVASTTNFKLSATGTAYFAGRVGLGTLSPTNDLSFGGANAQLAFNANSSFTSGLRVEAVSGTADALDFGINDTRFGPAQDSTSQGAFVRVDRASAEAPISFYVRPASGSLTQVLRAESSFNVNFPSTGSVAIGHSSPSAKLHVIATTEQLRLGNNTTNYSSFTVNSSGALTIAQTAATAGGSVAITQSVATTGTPNLFTVTGAAHTTITAAENTDINFNLARTVQFSASTSFATQRAFLIQAPTYAFQNGTGTITDAATAAITGAPVRGANTIFTNSHALLIQAGAVSSSVTNAYGLTVNAPTGGTNNYAAEFLSGNVGVGTSSPATLFSVATSSNIFNVLANGKVGVGTVSPSLVVTAFDATPTGNIVQASGWFSSNRSSSVGYHMYNGGGVQEWVMYQPQSSSDSNFHIGTLNSNVITDRVIIDTSGNFGINNSSPFSKFSVGGLPTESATSTLALLGSNFITGGSASGTFLGANPTSTFNGDFMNFQVGSSSKFRVTGTGATTIGNTLTVSSGGITMQSAGNSIGTISSTLFFNSSNIYTTFNYSVGTSTGSMLLTVGTSSAIFTVSSTGRVGVGTASPGALFDVNGTCTNFQTSHQCTDYAEIYPAAEPTETGEVLSIHSSSTKDKIVRKTTREYDANILGIVSSNPAAVVEGDSIQLMSGVDYKHNPLRPAVALAGRVPVKVSTENGIIQPGDFLTSSASKPGYAMKATRSGQVIGQALEAFDGTETISDPVNGSRPKETVLVFVKTGYQTINANFVLNSGLTASSTAATSSTTGVPFLINQKDTAAILTLQKDGVDTFSVENDGSVQMLTRVDDEKKNILTVSNNKKPVFAISPAGHIGASGDSAGEVVVRAGTREATVTFSTPYTTRPIVTVTPTSFMLFRLKQVSLTGFSVELPEPVGQDTTFEWMALARLNTEDTATVQFNTATVGGSLPPAPVTPSSPAPASTPPAAPAPQPSPQQKTSQSTTSTESLSTTTASTAPSPQPIAPTNSSSTSTGQAASSTSAKSETTPTSTPTKSEPSSTTPSEPAPPAAPPSPSSTQTTPPAPPPSEPSSTPPASSDKPTPTP